LIKIIAAIGKNRELGKSGHLIWHLLGDFRFFRQQTLNKTVVMGKNVFSSLSKKLSNRNHIVLSTKGNFNKDTEDVALVYKPEDLFALCDELSKTEDVYIIGGASIYRMFVDKADEIVLTEIDAECERADVYFPTFDKTKYRRKEVGNGQDGDVKYTHVVYTKIK